MHDDPRGTTGLSRRALLRRTLKTGVYAAPVILATTIITSPAQAATPVPSFVCVQPRTEFLIVFGRNQNPTASYDVYVAAITNSLGPLAKVGSFTNDPSGFVTTAFPVTFDYSVVRTVIVFTPPAGQPPRFPSGTYAPNSALICTPGATNLTPVLEVTATQRIPAAGITRYLEYIGVNLVNASPGAVYDVYARPDNANPAGAFTKVGTGSVNADGVLPFFSSETVQTQPGTGAPSAVTVNLVASGGPATPALFTTTVSFALTASLTAATSTNPEWSGEFRDRS